MNGTTNWEGLVELAVEAYIDKYYSDLKEEEALSTTHLYEAKQDIIKHLLSVGAVWDNHRGEAQLAPHLV